MRKIKVVAVIILLAGLAVAQDAVRHAGGRDVFSVARENRSLGMFVGAVQASGMTKMLRGESSLTVFALSNQAFANLPKEDLEALMKSPAAMHFLLAHYIVRGSVRVGDPAQMSSARTLVGVKLRTDIRKEATYVNGARLVHKDIRCANGMIHVINMFDMALVRDALAMSGASGTR